MVIVFVRPSLGNVPGTQTFIPGGEVFQFGVASTDIAFDEVATSIWSDLNVCIRRRTNDASF